MWNTQSSCEAAPAGVDLFSDLDNTLIYSHRRALPPDRVLAERLNGAEQSFMSARTLRFFLNTPQVRLIPVTTRSREQVQRIFLLRHPLACRYALVCNGGELLIDGVPDEPWLEETRRLAAHELPALSDALEYMRQTVPPEHIHTPSGLMVYGRCPDPAGTAARLRAELSGAALNILCDSRKVYCIPRSVNKGAAVDRFRHRFPTGFIAAAGDSEFDLPLLNAADLAVADPSLAGRLHNTRAFFPERGQLLSDFLCSVLEALLAQAPCGTPPKNFLK